MDKINLIHLKNHLKHELENLQRGVDCNFDGLKKSEENPPDLIDKASSFIERNLSQNICARESLKIRNVEQVLEDMENDVYGICKRCGEDIDIKRLRANPVARQCIRCKTEIETRERLRKS